MYKWIQGNNDEAFGFKVHVISLSRVSISNLQNIKISQMFLCWYFVPSDTENTIEIVIVHVFSIFLKLRPPVFIV